MAAAMKTLLLSSILAVAALQPACKGKSDSAAKSDVTWPAQPADGTPIVAEFVSLAGTGDNVEATLRLFNFADKDVTGVHMTLHYLDAAGKELKDFPWSQSKPSGLVEKKGTADIKAGAFIPAGTKTVTAEFRSVVYSDASTWDRK